MSWAEFWMVMFAEAAITTGASFAWGWAVGLFALGVVLVIWSLAKAIVQA